MKTLSNKKLSINKTDSLIENKGIINLITALFIASIILIPFDNIPYFDNLLGELSVKANVYPFLIIIPIVFFYTIKNRRIYLKNTMEIKMLVVYCFWICVSVGMNFNSILENSFKGRAGIQKLILQFMVLVFLLLISYSSSIIIRVKNIDLLKLRKYICLSLIPVGAYGFIELLNILNIVDFSYIIAKTSYFIQTYFRGEVYPKGIRSVTGEVSYFGMYCAFILPWIMSYIYTEKTSKKKILFALINIYLLVLIVFSKSRTAYAITFLQIFIYSMCILIFKTSKQNKKIVVSMVSGIVIMFFVINNTVISKVKTDVNSVSQISISSLVKSLSDKNNMSNVARSGMQRSAVQMGLDKPITGIGLGQYGFYAQEYLDEKAMTSDEVRRWINEENDSWPPVFSLFSRIIAEQGIVGIIIWTSMLIYMIFSMIQQLKRKKNDILGISLLVSFIGVIISWFNADMFSMISFWFLLPFIIKYNNQKNNNKKLNIETSIICVCITSIIIAFVCVLHYNTQKQVLIDLEINNLHKIAYESTVNALDNDSLNDEVIQIKINEARQAIKQYKEFYMKVNNDNNVEVNVISWGVLLDQEQQGILGKYYAAAYKSTTNALNDEGLDNEAIQVKINEARQAIEEYREFYMKASEEGNEENDSVSWGVLLDKEQQKILDDIEEKINNYMTLKTDNNKQIASQAIPKSMPDIWRNELLQRINNI